MMKAKAFVFFLSSLLAVGAAAGPGRPIDPTDHADRERMAKMLLKRVAYISAKAKPRATDAFRDEVQDGFGVALGPRRIVCLNFIVAQTESIVVQGPNGKKTPAKIILYDVERRVAILEPEVDVAELGLLVVEQSSVANRTIDQPVFALTATIEPYLVDGVLTDLGLEPELEGVVLSDLTLNRGMPAFDDQARLIGYARVVAWDTNKLMLISPETIALARTATKTESRPSTGPKKRPRDESPVWIRDTKEEP